MEIVVNELGILKIDGLVIENWEGKQSCEPGRHKQSGREPKTDLPPSGGRVCLHVALYHPRTAITVGQSPDSIKKTYPNLSGIDFPRFWSVEYIHRLKDLEGESR